MEVQELIDRIDKRFDKIEENQKNHNEANNARLDTLTNICTELKTQRTGDKGQIDDHEVRIRKNEKAIWQFGTIISLISGGIAASVTAFADKLFGGS